MDGQVTAGTLVCAIPNKVVVAWLTKRQSVLCQTLADTAAIFLKPGMTPADAHGFEGRVEVLVRELARSFEEWCFNSLEPQKVEAMPQHVEQLGQKCRRLKKKTRHATVLTRFGNITLTRATYRQGSRGRTIAPLEKILGIEYGATPGAQDLVGRQVSPVQTRGTRCAVEAGGEGEQEVAQEVKRTWCCRTIGRRE